MLHLSESLRLLFLLNPNSSANFLRSSGGYDNVSREMVLSAISTCNEFEMMCVEGLIGNLSDDEKKGRLAELAYLSGITMLDSFRTVAFESDIGKRDIFPNIFLASWNTLLENPKKKSSERWLANQAGMSVYQIRKYKIVVSDCFFFIGNSFENISMLINLELKMVDRAGEG